MILQPPAAEELAMRDPRYAPRRLDIERRDDGSMLLFNPGALRWAHSSAVDALFHWAGATPHAPWLLERSGDGWREIAYGEAAQRIGALAGGLAGLGLAACRPLLILARNGIDHALIAFAAMSQAIPIAPVSPQYGLPGADLSRLAHAVGLISPAAVYVDDAAAFSEALQADFLADLPVFAGANGRGAATALDALLSASAPTRVAKSRDIAKLLLTSGSTGRPKAVIQLHGAVAVNAAQIAACFDDSEPPVVVNQSPWSHSLGANAILQMVTHRGGVLYIDAGAPVVGRFAETVRNLREVAPTYHNMVPAGWDLLAGELEHDEALARRFFSRVRLLQYGGAALGQSTCDRIQAVAVATVGERISFASGYGATETGPTATNVHWPNLTMGLMGLPVPQTMVKLTPVDDRLEFRVKGPQVSPGYYNDPSATAAAFDEEGFYRLGDAARLVDRQAPQKGLIFDGRLAENFKLASGTFVNAGALRIAAVSAIGGAVTDAVVCGEGRGAAGLLLFLDPMVCRRLAPHGDLACDPAVRAAIGDGLARFNAAASGAGGRVARALIQDSPPDAHTGEITDKGYINQAASRASRAEAIARLFADPPPPDVIIVEKKPT